VYFIITTTTTIININIIIITSLCYQCMCPRIITFEKLMNLHVIWSDDHATGVQSTLNFLIYCLEYYQQHGDCARCKMGATLMIL
jgi:hypothetical protein